MVLGAGIRVGIRGWWSQVVSGVVTLVCLSPVARLCTPVVSRLPVPDFTSCVPVLSCLCAAGYATCVLIGVYR